MDGFGLPDGVKLDCGSEQTGGPDPFPNRELQSHVRELENLAADLDAATAEVLTAVDETFAGPSAEMDATTAEAVRVFQEVAGQVDLVLDPAVAQSLSTVDRYINDLTKQLDSGLNEIRNAGLNVPYDPAVMADMLAVDPEHWLPAVVPALGTITGRRPVVETCDAEDTTCNPGGPSVPPTPPTLPPTYPLPPADPPPVPPPPPPGTPGSCPTPSGLPWCTSPEGVAAIQAAYASGCTKVVSPVDPNTGEQFSTFYCWGTGETFKVCVEIIHVPPYGGPGSQAYTADDWCPSEPPFPPPPPPLPPSPPSPPSPPVPPVPPSPPTVPPPPPPPPIGQCPPQMPTCPPPVINVYPTVPCPTGPPGVPYPPGTPLPPPPGTPPTSPPGSPPTVPPTSPPTVPPPEPVPGGNTLGAGPYGYNWGLPIESCGELGAPIDWGEERPEGSIQEQKVPYGMDWLRKEKGKWFAVIPGLNTVEIGEKLIDGGEMGNESSKQTTGHALFKKMLPLLTKGAVPDPAAAAFYAPILTLAGLAESYIHAPVMYLATSVMYAFRATNPQFIPDQASLDELNIRGYITDTEWDCMTLAHGNHLHWAEKVADLRERKPGIAELVQLAYRGILNPVQLAERAKNLGWKDQKYVLEMVKLFEQYPGLPDQMRFLVRDSFDEDVVAQYDYDKDFDKKFNQEAKALAAATGVPERFFKLFWRAHWEIPSNTALFEMLSRLRPDRPERIAWEKDNPQDQFESDWDYHHRGPLTVTRDDVQNAIEVNDMSPGWVNPLIEVSYRPVTNTDAARMYQIGKMDERGLYHAFRNNHYNDQDANLLVEFYKSQTDQRIAGSTGILSLRQIVQRYGDGSLDRNDADQLLVPLLPDPRRRMDLLDRVDLDVRVTSRSIAIKATRKEFLTAGIEAQEAADRLGKMGVPTLRIGQLLDRWNFEREHNARHATAGMLCKWRGRGLITADEHYRRLRIIGFSIDDASRISQVCEVEHEEKVIRDADAARRRAIADARQNLKDRQLLCKALLAIDPSLKDVLGEFCTPKGDGGQNKPGGGGGGK